MLIRALGLSVGLFLATMFADGSAKPAQAAGRLDAVMETSMQTDVIRTALPDFVDRFRDQIGSEWQIAEYDFIHPIFDTDWRRDLVQITDRAVLSLQPREDEVAGSNRFLGAAFRRTQPTGYGRYEAWMRAGRGAGVVTGFFAYTGPYYGTRHDEIDMEFLGQDTRKVQLSWWVDGVLRSHVVPLGFDAAAGMHHYAFDWMPEGVRWFVDGRLIYQVTEGPLPRYPGYLSFNLWAVDPSVASWAGHAQPQTRTRAEVFGAGFTPFSDPVVAPFATLNDPALERGDNSGEGHDRQGG